MVPAQPLGTDEKEGKPIIVVKSEEKKEGNELGLVCHSNFEDSGFYGDSAAAKDRVENNALDQEVDVLGLVDGEVVELEKSEDDPDATEQSSSFGNTFSGSEDEARMSSSDMEVDSQFSLENGNQPVLDGIGRLLKKKKVTDHWRGFINPLMWRCQWLELRMNELRSQALLYDRELTIYKREKQLQSKMIELDDSVSKSVPFTCQSHRKRAMKRKKRKRIEDTVDIPSYMSNHNVFSYYENKRAETDCQSVDNECEDQVDEILKPEDYEWILLGLKDGDNSLEEILLNLDGIQSRIYSLKTQLSEVMCRNPRDFSSRSPSCSPGNNGDAMPCELELPGSAVSSYGDAADVIHHQHDQLINDVMMTNEIAHEEYKKFEGVGHEAVVLQEVVKEEAESCSEDAKTALKSPAAPPILKPCYTGKKRGRKPKRKRRGGFASRIQKRQLN